MLNSSNHIGGGVCGVIVSLFLRIGNQIIFTLLLSNLFFVHGLIEVVLAILAFQKLGQIIIAH
jgi:hypothetical protein